MNATPPIALAFAIPDHPWVDSVDGAAVRIAMTVGTKEENLGKLQTVISETQKVGEDETDVILVEHKGRIMMDLTVGADVAGAQPLLSNSEIAIKGFELGGQGFLMDEQTGMSILKNHPELSVVIHPYCTGNDLKKGQINRFVIDFHGKTEKEAQQYAIPYQYILDRVMPQKAINREERTKKNWWLFRRSGEKIRIALQDLERFIGTTRTAKFRIFQFLPKEVIAESSIVIIALSEGYILGVLSSSIHVNWSLAVGGWLGVGNDPTYNHINCFNKFPFPIPTQPQTVRIRDLGERLDAHRKRQQGLFPELTMTDMYNVLEKVRSGVPLTEKERRTHEMGLVGILKQLHDELDAAVAEAYGWPADLPEAEILERLVRLNAERAAEEASGLVRWLRPEYQAPGAAAAGVQGKLMDDDEGAATESAPVEVKRVWPDSLAAQAAVLRDVLQSLDTPADVSAIAAVFEGKKTTKRLEQIQRLLETLAALGQAVEVREGVWGR